ncbi:MAG: hypothetical protein IPL70_12445 [Uliginosibacterium sp.]|nr:hypothetical protein [Uliginosibacterium sp.]
MATEIKAMSMLRRVLAYLASIRLRSLFRAIFLALSLATVALALVVLREEKQQAFDNYREGFRKTGDQIAARLRHPTGQLALLNPQAESGSLVPLRPMLLPYAALDFDFDPAKVRNAIEMAGCLVRPSPNDAALCVAIAPTPGPAASSIRPGGYTDQVLQPHPRGERRPDQSASPACAGHLRGRRSTAGWRPSGWIASWRPTGEKACAGGSPVLWSAGMPITCRPGQCVNSVAGHGGRLSAAIRRRVKGYEHEVFYSLRLPVVLLREALFDKKRLQWHRARSRPISACTFRCCHRATKPPVFDSNGEAARAPFLLSELRPLLLPGESLSIRKLGAKSTPG